MSTRRSESPEELLAMLVALLEVVVFERLHGGAFRQVGGAPTPSWFAESFKATEPGAPVTLLQAFPVLDAFLSEAEIFWERTAYGRLEGEAVVVSGPGGRNLPLATIAVAMEGRQFLLIQRVTGFDDRQDILQTARDQALQHESVVKRIDAVRHPIGRLTRLANELASSENLSDSQRTLLNGIESELETARQLLADLPKLPPASTPRGR
jgi:hypothetical protein